MGVFGKGMAFLQEQNAQLGSYGDRLPKLWLKDGDAAKFWFLYPPDEVPVPLVHMEARFSKKNNNPYNQDVLCARLTLDDPRESCPRCVKQDADPQSGLKGPFPRAVFVVWCDVIAHKANPNNQADWKLVKRQGGGHIYIQTLKGLALFLPGRKQAELLDAALSGDPLDPTKGPVDILSVPWKLEVTGAQQMRVETIIPYNPEAIPQEVKAAREALPDLDEIIRNEYGPTPGAKTVAAGNGAARPAPAAGAEGNPDDAVEYGPDELPSDKEPEYAF